MNKEGAFCLAILLILIFVTLVSNSTIMIREQKKLVVIAQAQKEAQIQMLFELRKINQCGQH